MPYDMADTSLCDGTLVMMPTEPRRQTGPGKWSARAHRFAHRLVLVAVVVSTLCSARDASAADEASIATAVTFGTTCARCHEGECSGRLSFNLGVEATTSHLIRHAGPLTKNSIRQLFAMLEYMKRECSYPPLNVPIPTDGIWSSSALAQLCRPLRHSYFIPLGDLDAGRHSLELEFGNEPHMHAEVVTWTFDLLIDQPLEIEDGRARVELQTTESSQAFLRLVAREPIEFERLTLDGVDGEKASD